MKLSRGHFAYIIDCYMTARTTAKNEFKGYTDLKKLLFKLEDDNSNFDMTKAVKYIEKNYGIVL